MAGFKTMTMGEFARTVNGGVDVSEMYLAGMNYRVKKPRRIFNVNGRLTYQTDSGTTAFIMSGDVLYLKNGQVVEVV
jgi:hypothetical protein